jgi:mono/diheme cytochrome c family protein
MMLASKAGRTRTQLWVGGLCLLLIATPGISRAFAALTLRSQQPRHDIATSIVWQPAAPLQTASADTRGKPTFSQDIAPIFQKNCLACHGSEKPQGGLRLDNEAATLKGGESGKVIVPGDSEKSLLIKRLLGVGEQVRMPMGADPLPAGQIATIRAWIDQNSFAQAGSEMRAVGAGTPPGGAVASPVAAHTTGSGSGVYASAIRPILVARCYQCHGSDLQQNGLRLDSLAAILKGSANGSVVIPGDGAKSPLVRRISGLDRPQMPYGGPPLSSNDVELIRAWIDHGAQGPDTAAPIAAGEPVKHWAYVKPVQPDVPNVTDPAWCRNPIDNFVMARLAQEGLRPSPAASKETLIRRVSLDLIGLPPTPAETDAFLADHSSNAYEKVVDRLLASPHFGERWAGAWLDLARYADTNGYEKDMRRTMWKYRDWVINAFNEDMSFREFTIEQIAGDMLPKPTTEQLIASGFNRNTMTNMEGGVDPEEYYWYTQVDRVNTTATVWLGSTLGCAQCHNHKFDPFTQKDYYRFLSFFAGEQYVDDFGGDTYAREPSLELPTPEQAAKSKELRAEIAKLQTVLDTPTPALAAAQTQWEQDIKAADAKWTVLQPGEYASKGGATFKLLSDGSLLATGKNPDADSYQVSATTELTGITAVRLEVMSDPGLPAGGPGRDATGNFFLSTFEVHAAPAEKPASAVKIVFKEAAADESQSGYDFDNLVNDKPQPKGWGIDTSDDKSTTVRQGVLIPDKPFGFAGGTMLTIQMKHDMPFSKCGIGRFRISVTTMADPRIVVSIPARLRNVLDLPPAQRPEKSSADLAAAYRAIAPLLKPTRDKKKEIEEADSKLGIATTLVMGERNSFERPCTNVHIRGAFLSVGDKVCAGVPFILNPLPDDQMPNRLGLANWLVSDDNPLTARVTVNRYWEQLFGRGIVETSEDFGTQGSPPTNQQLLDWLATEFMRDGWSMKKMLRLIATSATYRQSSSAMQELEEKDPYNLLLARGPRFRVPAEMVRDIALEASGLLSPKIGGPSVFPPQPAGVWDRPYNDDKWEESKGEDRYRRSLYTFIRRTSPYPSWTTFDAPTREFCTVRRVRTNTPLQALTTLNDPAFFEAAQALAGKILREGGPNAASRATFAFRRCLTRGPTTQELDRILTYYRHEVNYFQNQPKAAASVAKGYSGPPASLPQAAAWTMVSNVLLNLDEAITKE